MGCGYIGYKHFDSLEEEIKYYIDGLSSMLKDVANCTLKELDSRVREDFFTLSIVTLSTYSEYPTNKDLERVSRIVRFSNEKIKNIFPPEYYQHVLKENMFIYLDTMIVFYTTKLVVKYENQLYREKPLLVEEGKAKLSWSFCYLNLLKRITEYLIGSSPRKATTSQLLTVSFLIQAQTNYIMNNLEILDLCRGRNAEYAISPHGSIIKKSFYEEEMKKSKNSILEAAKVSYEEAKERRERRERQEKEKREEQEWEELQRLYEEEEEEERREEEEQERIWMEEEERKRKEKEEHFRQMREMDDIMAYDDMLRYGHYI